MGEAQRKGENASLIVFYKELEYAREEPQEGGRYALAVDGARHVRSWRMRKQRSLPQILSLVGPSRRFAVLQWDGRYLAYRVRLITASSEPTRSEAIRTSPEHRSSRQLTQSDNVPVVRSCVRFVRTPANTHTATVLVRIVRRWLDPSEPAS